MDFLQLIFLAMMGGDLTGDGGSTSNPNLSFPPIKLRYDPSEVENELAAIEEAVEEAKAAPFPEPDQLTADVYVSYWHVQEERIK